MKGRVDAHASDHQGDMDRHTLVNHFLEYSAEKFPNKVALVHHGTKLSYSEIDRMANKLANALISAGIERGDRVAVFMDNSVEAVISIFGAMKAGAAFMMINHTTKAEKFEYVMNNSRARVLLTQDNRADVISAVDCPFLKTIIMTGSYNDRCPFSCEQFEDIMSSGDDRSARIQTIIDLDLAAIIYTSGSTGNPKGVMLSHLNMVSAAHSITSYLENNVNDIILNLLPLSFDYGLYQVLMGFKVGGTVVLEKSFTYSHEVLHTMEREKVTGFPCVPTLIAILLRLNNIRKYDLSSLRYITNTADILPVSSIEKLRELFPWVKLYSMYGLTECKRVSFLPPDQIDRRPSSVGKGMPNEEVYIVNEKGERVGPGEIGELVVRGSNVMLGYWEMPEETAKCLKDGRYAGDKVLYTGDLFRMDEERYLYFVARKDDIIKCKGEKVSPKEVERVLCNLEGIQEAATVGIADEISGHTLKAYVVLDKGSELTKNDILKHCSLYMEDFMVPKYIEIMESLPRTSSGKVSKKILEDMTLENAEYAARIPVR